MNFKKLIVFSLAVGFIGLTGCKKSDSDASPAAPLPSWKQGQVIKDEKGWFELEVGDIPLVISVPHGGTIQLDRLPNRDNCEDAVTVLDSYTVPLAEAIKKEFAQRYNLKPTVLITHLSRKHIDQNRELEESFCEEHPELFDAWHWYHDHLDSAVRYAVAEHGESLFIDLHAHGHSVQRLELGYGLTIAEIGRVYSGLDLDELMAKSTLANYKNVHGDVDLRELMIGPEAFGTLMHARDVPSVPSEQDPYLMSTDDYFNGGYNSRYFTSEDYPKTYGWQIEVNSTARNTPERQEHFASAFAESIVQLLKLQ